MPTRKKQKDIVAPSRCSELQQLFMQHTDNVVIILTPDFLIKEFNLSAERVYGWKKEAVLGGSFPQLCRQQGYKYPKLRTLKRALDGKVLENIRLCIAPGRSDLSWTIVPLWDKQSEIDGLLLIGMHAVEREQWLKLQSERDDAEKSNKAKSEFLAVMSHELRTPLNGIMGAAQIILARQPRDDQREFLEDIYRSGNVLLMLINDVLDLSKLEAGKLEFAKQPCDLEHVIQELLASLSHLAAEKGLKLFAKYPKGTPHHILGDVRRLRQLLFNLVGNAIKYTEKGQVSIRVKCLQRDDTEAKLKISIVDTGIGIPPDKIGFVFDRFNQLNYSGSSRGTGLGLSIVKQLVQQMGGTIHVKSQLHKGSTFWIVLPLLLQDAEMKKLAWPKQYADMRVMMVSSSEERGRQLLTRLAKPGASVVSPEDVLELLEAAKTEAHPYELLLMDDEEAGSDLLALASTILAKYEFTAPVLCLLTDSDDELYHETALNAGFSRCWVKPISIHRSFRSIVSLLNKRRAHLNKQSYKILSNAKVLLVEDNLINQKIARVMLEEEGCCVEIAGTGQSALEAVSNNHYDAIFMDIGLPDTDGYQVTIEIRKRQGEKGRTPIIAMTANAFDSDKQRCLEVGMDAFISKPVGQRELQEVLLEKVLQVADG